MITSPLAALLIFVGTATPKGGASRGVYAVELDPATGAFGPATLAAETPNPTFLAWHPRGHTLYALGEGEDPSGQISGGATAFAYDPANRRLTARGGRGGGAPTTHLAVDAGGRALLTAAYGGGTVTSFALLPDGRIGPRVSALEIAGPLGPRAARQDKSHPHSVTLSPDDRFAYVCALGLDRVCVFALDSATAALQPAGEFATAPGAGPRHSKISDDGRFLYAINELDATITVFARDLATGALAAVQSVATLPAEYPGENTCAEIRLHPNGRFVYGSNRGHDSLVVFARDAARGTLALVQHIPCGGRHPRNFILSPDGRWLVCANRDSSNLVSFRVDPESGRLTASGHTADVPQAVCVLFAS